MEQLVYKKPDSVKDNFKVSFCPGCDHGVAMKIVAEVLDELEVNALAINKNDSTALIVAVDNGLLPKKVVDLAKENFSAA